MYWPATAETPAYIFFNEAHAPTRQASDISHECAHDILGHEAAAVFDRLGIRDWDKEQEAEAEYLAGALLVTAEGAIWAIRRGMSDRDAAAHFGVSSSLYMMRVNKTAARKRATLVRG
jgi:Zn-dependent peptidase ImmA (M78 family)